MVALSACSMRHCSSSYRLCIFNLLTVTRVRALQIHGWASRAHSNPSCRPLARVRRRPYQSEPGPAGSHKTALKKFLSVSELALDRQRMLDFRNGSGRNIASDLPIADILAVIRHRERGTHSLLSPNRAAGAYRAMANVRFRSEHPAPSERSEDRPIAMSFG
jgi:hypothetical protein